VEKFIEDFDMQELAGVQFRLLSSLMLHKTQRLINKNDNFLLYFVRVCNLVSYTKGEISRRMEETAHCKLHDLHA
jgi:hypothetical protein